MSTATKLWQCVLLIKIISIQWLHPCCSVSTMISAVCFRVWVSNCGGSAWWRRHTAVPQIYQYSVSNYLVQTGQQNCAPLCLPYFPSFQTCSSHGRISKWKIWNELQYLHYFSEDQRRRFIGLRIVFLWTLLGKKIGYCQCNIFGGSR